MVSYLAIRLKRDNDSGVIPVEMTNRTWNPDNKLFKETLA